LEIKLNDKLFELSKNIDFSELCITSGAKVIKDNAQEIEIISSKASGKKCPICWKISLEECSRHPMN
jgi:isoleucyl-tRNA synthetase